MIGFRQRVRNLTFNDYVEHYKGLPDIMGETDLNRKCLERILIETKGSSVLDVGCGRGFLCHSIILNNPNQNVTGVDIFISAELKKKYKKISFFNQKSKIFLSKIIHLTLSFAHMCWSIFFILIRLSQSYIVLRGAKSLLLSLLKGSIKMDLIYMYNFSPTHTLF